MAEGFVVTAAPSGHGAAYGGAKFAARRTAVTAEAAVTTNSN